MRIMGEDGAFPASCSAERGVHGKASSLGRMLVEARASPSSGEKLATLLTGPNDAECHIAYILLILFPTLNSLWH